MDRCHQTPAGGGAFKAPTVANAMCEDPNPSGDLGMVQAYGLVYRLMQNKIPVYWMVNPTKDPPLLTASQNLSSQQYSDRDIDFWLLSSGATPVALGSSLTVGAPPVLRYNQATGTAIAGSYTRREFPTRGAAFVIRAEDRDRFDEFMSRTGEFAGFAGNSLYDFSLTDIYEVQPGAEFAYQDFRSAGPNYVVFNGGNSAPVAVVLDYEPPRLAREVPANVSTLWLSDAKLNEAAAPGCTSGAFSPPSAVYCDVTDAQIQAGVLSSGNFDWAWLDNWQENTNCAPASAGETQMLQMETFMKAVPGVKDGRSIMFMGKTVTSAEQCKGKEPLGAIGNGLNPNTSTVSEPLIIRPAASIFNQWGDVPTAFASGSSASSWTYPSGYNVSSTLVRLVSADTGAGCTGHISTPGCDVFPGDTPDLSAYARFADEPANGLAFYMGGRNVSQNGNASHLRMLLNAFLAIPLGTVDSTPPVASSIVEVARSSPIIETVDGIEASYQGTVAVIDPPETVTTYSGAADDLTFRFPYYRGHMRAVDLSVLSTTATQFDSLTPVFDAAQNLPPVRVILTSVTSGDNSAPPFSRPTTIAFAPGNVPQLQGPLGGGLTPADTATLISRVHAGRDDDNDTVFEAALGGVDRSTVAIVGTSPLIGTTRPTIIYFGALDGMLHAVCADIEGPCTAKGQELWAYIPRTQLPRLRLNTQRIDGSPTVADVFGDFDGDGRREWRTILTFQTGSGDPGFSGLTPSVVAIDITNPDPLAPPGDGPTVLWEVTTPDVRAPHELGVGLNTIMAPVKKGSDIRYYTFAQTNNGGTAPTASSVIKGINTITGVVPTAAGENQTFVRPYPTARSGGPPVPVTGYASGVAGVPDATSGFVTKLVMPSLYGELWLLNAPDIATSSNMLFQFTTDFHPIGATPTVFRKGAKLMALGVSGGYADPVNVLWSPSTVTQYAVAMPVDTPATPVTEVQLLANAIPDGFAINLGAGNRAFSQATVAGNELFIVTDSTNINESTFGVNGLPTGLLTRVNLGSPGTATTYVVQGGAGSIDASGGLVVTGSGDKAEKKDFTSDFDAAGGGTTAVDSQVNRSGRELWLRLR